MGISFGGLVFAYSLLLQSCTVGAGDFPVAANFLMFAAQTRSMYISEGVYIATTWTYPAMPGPVRGVSGSAGVEQTDTARE